MEIKESDLDGGIKVLSLVGSMDIEGASVVDDPLKEAAANCDRLIINLGEVDFLASIGIRTLVKTAKAVQARNGLMAVSNAQPAAQRVFEATGVADLLGVVADQSAAVARVSK